jgi:hypothetical protein
MPASNPLNSGSFVPTTNIWDVSEIYNIEKMDPKLQELLVRLYQNLNIMSLVLNTKESGFYVLSQFVDGNVWFSSPILNSNSSTTPALRQEYCKVYWTAASLGINTTTTIPHGITVTSATTFTDVYGEANDTTNFLYARLPYASNTAGRSIELYNDNTNIYIITGSAPLSTTFNITYVVLKWLQN